MCKEREEYFRSVYGWCENNPSRAFECIFELAHTLSVGGECQQVWRHCKGGCYEVTATRGRITFKQMGGPKTRVYEGRRAIQKVLRLDCIIWNRLCSECQKKFASEHDELRTISGSKF